jgi:hypothetical protein
VSRARYVFRDGRFVERKTGEPMRAPDRIASPYVLSDVAYRSPLSGREITSRSQRREEMKVHEVREVDPSEYRPVYRKKANAVKHRGEHNPDAGRLTFVDEAPFRRMAKDELPARIAQTITR